MTTHDAPRRRLLSQEEVAEICGVAPRTVQGWRLRRVGPAWVRCGRVARYTSEAVDAWLAEHTHDSRVEATG